MADQYVGVDASKEYLDVATSRVLLSRDSIVLVRFAVAKAGLLRFHRHVPYARRSNGRRSMNRLTGAQAKV